ncbi:MAG: hypothetical protein E7016_03115 [Alphaproteobacteria bacterium]|nr:hypothetical protein [Alphaproteobacteria bacterium]
MNYKFGIYGDSIAFGYGNNNQSWFDELYSGNKALKLAQNGEKTEDVLRKIKQDNNRYDILFLAVGINNLLSDAPQCNPFAIAEFISQYEQILLSAQDKASKIVVQSVLPAQEKLFPNQAWLDKDKWVFYSDIEIFNQSLANLCNKHKVQFIDAYAIFCLLNLSDIYTDGVHLNTLGQNILASIYKQNI